MIDLNKVLSDSLKEKVGALRDQVNETLGLLQQASKKLDTVFFDLYDIVPMQKKTKKKVRVRKPTLQEQAWQGEPVGEIAEDAVQGIIEAGE